MELLPEKLENFFSKGKVFYYKKSETILRGGDEPPGVFYLKEGFARLYSLSREGEELTLIIFKPQDFFPIIWAINDTPNPYYLEAMTSVRVYRAARQEFVEFLKKSPDVFFELTSRTLVRFGGILSRMEYLAFGNAYSKVASIVLICADRFGEKVGDEIVIQIPLTHKEIANLVGVTRETASIEMKKLERKGIIGYHGRRLLLKDTKALMRIVPEYVLMGG